MPPPKSANEETPLLVPTTTMRQSADSPVDAENSDLSHPDPATTTEEETQPMNHNNNAHDFAPTHANDKSNLILLVCVAAATAATLGYDVGIMAAAIQPLEHQLELTSIQKEVAMGSLNFVAAFGAFLGGHVADAYGRKTTIFVCCWLFIIGTIGMAASWTYALLLVGRIVTGLGVGVAFVAAPSYISEVAPADSRGQLNTIFDISINGGILVGYITGFLVQLFFPDNWRLMLGCGMILPMIVLVFLIKLPESPRWLMLVHRKTEAGIVLRHLGNSERETEKILQDMYEELEREKQDVPPPFGPGQQYAVKVGFWQQITGTEAVLYYSADYLQRAGLESPLMRLGGNVFVGVCKLVPECIAMNYIDTAGRRPLLFGSALMLCLTTLALSIAFSMHASPYLIVMLLCSVMASFSGGLGPFTFLSASENLAMSERAIGLTYCSFMNRITSGTVAMTAVSVSDWIGDAGLFGLYAVAGFCSLFFYWNIPETAGATLEELSLQRSYSMREENQHTEALHQAFSELPDPAPSGEMA